MYSQCPKKVTSGFVQQSKVMVMKCRLHCRSQACMGAIKQCIYTHICTKMVDNDDNEV